MKAFFERACVLALSLALVCSFVPATAFADDTSADTGSTESGTTDTGTTGDGDDGSTTDPDPEPTPEPEPEPVVKEKVYSNPVFVGKVKTSKRGGKVYKISVPRVRFTVTTINAKTKEVISTGKSDAYAMTVKVAVPNKGWKKATSSKKYYTYNAGSDTYIQAVSISVKKGSKLAAGLKQSGMKIYYRASVKNFGTLGWAKQGQKAGTTGQSCALTGLKVKLAKKTPGTTKLRYFTAPTVKYQVRYKGKSSYNGAKKDGATAGKESWKSSISGLTAKLSNTSFSGGIKYSVRTSKHEGSKYWSSWASNGSKLGVSKKAKVQAIRIKLTGTMAKKYDVYYRVYCGDHHWLGWAKNGQLTGSKKISYPIGGVQVKLVVKGNAAPGSTSGRMRSTIPATGGQLAMLRRAQSFSSGTGYLILVNRGMHQVGVFTGSQGNWKLKYFWSCVTGKPSTPTITGTFHTTGAKLGHLPDWPNARYATQIYGGYFFHTTLSGSWELGYSSSHGCIRLAVGNAIWVYNNISGGTTVNIYN